ncbi:hypothetical protein EGN69_13640 [Pseudomonas monteilii]|nr:hypothetical protein EGN69_13640 [Pseudomonas monteilii]
MRHECRRTLPVSPDRKCWLLRGHARSRRYCANVTDCTLPVGAGMPAKRPVQENHSFSSSKACITCSCPP